MKNCSVTPPSKESALSIAVATASPYKLGMWEWSPADMAKHEMLIAEASAPMRSMFDMLAGGEVLTIKGRAVMEMPAGFGTVELGEWVETQPAMEGWIDCMERIDKELPNRALKQLSRYLGAGLPLTPELVDNARREFDTHLRRMRTMLPSQIKDAAVTAQIAWEFERIKKETEIMNARDNAPTLPAIDGAINAAHGLLLKSGDALSADDVAKALAIKKAEASKQLRELNGMGLLESEPRKGGTMFFRLAIAAPKPEVCDLVQTEGESQTDTLAADADGWIPWNATADGVSPVPGKTKVSVRLKDGDVLRSTAENLSWVSGQCIPIVAYKILDAALANFATSPEMQYLDPEDCVMPDPDPALLASANRMLHDRLERVAHVLRGCGLPALADVGHEDLQMAAAALSGAYQMALAENIALKALNETMSGFGVEREAQREPEKSSKYLATVITASIHRPSENPIFGEGVTHVTIADEGAGAFLRLCQFDASQSTGEVVIDIDELDLIRDVGRKMIEELPGEKEWSDV